MKISADSIEVKKTKVILSISIDIDNSSPFLTDRELSIKNAISKLTNLAIENGESPNIKKQVENWSGIKKHTFF